MIVAMSENRVIGKAGGLPWHISDDLKRFKALTMGKPIVMGRKTYESIGRLLPGRLTVILTRQKDYHVEGAMVCPSLDDALQRLADHDEIFIVGGGDIYRQSLALADRIHLTLVHQRVEGDTFFPELPPDFIETAREQHPGHAFITLERRRV